MMGSGATITPVGVESPQNLARRRLDWLFSCHTREALDVGPQGSREEGPWDFLEKELGGERPEEAPGC